MKGGQRFKMTVSHHVSLKHRHPGFNQIEPGRLFGSVQPPNALAKVLLEPTFDRFTMGAGIVPDDDNLHVIRQLPEQPAQKPNNSPRIVFAEATPPNLSSMGIQSGQQIACAMALILVGYPGRFLAWAIITTTVLLELHRPLLVKAQEDGVFGRINVAIDNCLGFTAQFWVGRVLPALRLLKANALLVQDRANGFATQLAHLGFLFQVASQMRQRPGVDRHLQLARRRGGDFRYLQGLLSRVLSWPSAARLVEQSQQTLAIESLDPGPNAAHTQTNAWRDLARLLALRRLQNDLGSLHQLYWRTAGLLNGLQQLIFLILKGSNVYCRFGTSSRLVLAFAKPIIPAWEVP